MQITMYYAKNKWGMLIASLRHRKAFQVNIIIVLFHRGSIRRALHLGN